MGFKEQILKKRAVYTKQCMKDAYQYEKDVLSGKIIACEWIKLAIARRKRVHEKYHFSKKEVENFFDFIFYTKAAIGGKIVQFKPMPWQCWVILNIFGYYRDKELENRLYRFVTIWVSRKSGKTFLAALFSLYALIKGEMNAEVYFCAPTKLQATQALEYLKQIVDASPALKSGKGKVIKREYKLKYEQNGSCKAVALANEPDKLDGLFPSFAIIDEKHALPDNKLFNIIKTGTGPRKNPLIITISTSGFSLDAPFYNEIEVGKRVLNQEIDDESTFYAYYTLDDEEDIDNPEMWIKSNPGIGVVTNLETLKIDYEKSCLSVSDKKNFITKNLNVFVDGEDEWIPDVNYKKNFNDVNLKELKGCKAYMGLDLSNSRDLSSLVIVVENPKTKKLEVIPEFYFPAGSGDKKIRASGIDLTDWIDKGHILEHEGNIIDYDMVFERINYYCEYFDVQGIGYDPWNAVLLINRIQEEILVDVKACRQNTGFFNFPLKFIERLIFSETINLSKNPCLRWNFRNVVIWQDGNGNIKIVKNKSKDSVDGAVALGMAVGLYAEMNFDAIASLIESMNKE